MLKQTKSPDGYKYLLVYKKADELLSETSRYTSRFPRILSRLIEQMDSSARSTKQNIVEGWKRNATYEYYTFLGYSIASNAELMEDYQDICLGRYKEKGIRGEMGERGKLEALRFYPVDSRLPLSVQLYLRCKEINFLLDKLQSSLVEHMKEHHTLSNADRWRLAEEKRQQKQKELDDDFKNWLKKENKVFTACGIMSIEEAKKRNLDSILPS